MRWHRDYDGGYPPLASDVMPDVTSADDPAYAGQGYDRAAHVERLRTAHFHAKECAKSLKKAIDAMQFDPDVDANPEGEP